MYSRTSCKNLRAIWVLYYNTNKTKFLLHSWATFLSLFLPCIVRYFSDSAVWAHCTSSSTSSSEWRNIMRRGRCRVAECPSFATSMVPTQIRKSKSFSLTQRFSYVCCCQGRCWSQFLLERAGLDLHSQRHQKRKEKNWREPPLSPKRARKMRVGRRSSHISQKLVVKSSD